MLVEKAITLPSTEGKWVLIKDSPANHLPVVDDLNSMSVLNSGQSVLKDWQQVVDDFNLQW